MHIVSLQSVVDTEDEDEGSFDEDVLSGTGVSNLLLVVLLERPPEIR